MIARAMFLWVVGAYFLGMDHMFGSMRAPVRWSPLFVFAYLCIFHSDVMEDRGSHFAESIPGGCIMIAGWCFLFIPALFAGLTMLLWPDGL